MKDLVEREGLFYKKFTDVPFTGEEQKVLDLAQRQRITDVHHHCQADHLG
jgi:hypothetical protein